MMNDKLNLLQLLFSSGLLVLIWLVQILHYPSFVFYERSEFAAAMEFHQRRISYLVLPLMLGELALAMTLVLRNPDLVNGLILGLIATVWTTTFFVQVPLHGQLTVFDYNRINRLVRGNWLRTILWSLNFTLVLSKEFL
mgnify:CR=1 FL=1